jgi:hypothetical protein
MSRFVLFFIVLVFGAGSYGYYVSFLQPKVVHYHAGFQVYRDGRLVDFSDVRYMHLKPCTTEVNASRDEQMEKAHLHDLVGDVVHVHRSNARWGDLFRNMKYEIDSLGSLTGFVNGREVDGILNYPINAYDSVVLLIGEHDNPAKYLKKAVRKDHVLMVENTSEDCGN